MSVCLLISDGRNTPAGERITAVASRMKNATVVSTGDGVWPDGAHVDEVAAKFDIAIAFGWRACLHVFRVDAKSYGYRVPALEEAQMWQGDERRLLAALTYDLPLTLVAPNATLARALQDRGRDRRVAVVVPGVERASATSSTGDGPLRVASPRPAEEILARASQPVEAAEIDSADVLLDLAPAGTTLAAAQQALVRGVVPVVTPVDTDLITDGEDGFVIGFDDGPGAARALDLLARDRALLEQLRTAARARGEQQPTIADEAAALLDAVKKPAPTDRWPAQLLLNARAAFEPVAQERRALEKALRASDERIKNLTDDRAYRVGKRLEPLWGPVARRRDK